MGMTIDDCVSELTWVRKVNEEVLKIDAKELDIDSAWIKHWENVVKSLDMAIETMRKYHKIQEIVARWKVDTWTDGVSYDSVVQISEVVEDGNNT